MAYTTPSLINLVQKLKTPNGQLLDAIPIKRQGEKWYAPKKLLSKDAHASLAEILQFVNNKAQVAITKVLQSAGRIAGNIGGWHIETFNYDSEVNRQYARAFATESIRQFPCDDLWNIFLFLRAGYFDPTSFAIFPIDIYDNAPINRTFREVMVQLYERDCPPPTDLSTYLGHVNVVLARV